MDLNFVIYCETFHHSRHLVESDWDFHGFKFHSLRLSVCLSVSCLLKQLYCTLLSFLVFLSFFPPILLPFSTILGLYKWCFWKTSPRKTFRKLCFIVLRVCRKPGFFFFFFFGLSHLFDISFVCGVCLCNFISQATADKWQTDPK